MAEQEYQIHNTKLLVIAGALGLVAVVLFYVHDWKLRNEHKQDLVPVLRTTRAVATGELLELKDLEIAYIPSSVVPTEMSDDITRDVDINVLVNMKLVQDVEAGKIMRWSYVIGGHDRGGSAIEPQVGYMLVPIEVDRDTSPPNLNVGAYVDLWTTLTNERGELEPVPVMEKVLVKAINGQGRSGNVGRFIDSVSVEVRKIDAEGLLAFKETEYKLTLVVRNSGEKVELMGFNPRVKKILNLHGANQD